MKVVVLDHDRDVKRIGPLAEVLGKIEGVDVVGLSMRKDEANSLYELSKILRSEEDVQVVVPGAMWWYEQAKRNARAGGATLWFINSAPLPDMRGNSFRLCRGSDFLPGITGTWWMLPEKMSAIWDLVWQRSCPSRYRPIKSGGNRLVVGQLPADKTLALSEHALDAAHCHLARVFGATHFKPHPSDDRVGKCPPGLIEVDRDAPYMETLISLEMPDSASLSSMAAIQSRGAYTHHTWYCGEPLDASGLALSIFKDTQIDKAAALIAGATESFEDIMARAKEAWT